MFNFGMKVIVRSLYRGNLYTLHFCDGTRCQIMKVFGYWRPLFVPKSA
jgi:hypothetical protein